MTAQVAGSPVGPAPTVVAMVTGQDLLAQFNHLSESQARIESKVDGIPRQVADLASVATANSQAIVELKQRWAFMAGIGCVISLLLSSGTVIAIVTALHR